MTIDQFVEKLARLRYKKTGKPLRWCVMAGTPLIRVSAGGQYCCPLTAVAYAETGTKFDIGTFGIEAALSMPIEDTASIIRAADKMRRYDKTGHNRALRARLLEACGLPAEAK